MTYVFDTRALQPSIYDGPNGLKETRFNQYDYVYSWRTGKGRKGRTAINIPPPVNQASDLVGSIKRRKSFYQDLDATLGSRESNEPPTRCLVGDEGHAFITAKFLTKPGRIIHSHPTAVTKVQQFSTLSNFWMPDYVVAPGLRPIERTKLSTTQTVPWTTVRKRINSSFADMNPGGPSVKLGETIVELVSGNIPKLLQSLPKLIAREKSLHKSLGDEYLAVQFGWMPIINDIMSLIKTLMILDSMVYTGSDRRHRGLRPDVFSETSSISTAAPFTVPVWREGLEPSSYGGGMIAPPNTTETTIKSDHRISARFTALARPTRGANAFVDQAEDIVRELGIWYPALGWDLLPYSFLVDWFVNLGDSITNAYVYGSKGQTNIDYAYLTSRYTTVKYTNFDKAETYNKKSQVTARGVNSIAVSDVKVRQAISPYGLGIDISALSGFQMSILVALGLARGK